MTKLQLIFTVQAIVDFIHQPTDDTGNNLREEIERYITLADSGVDFYAKDFIQKLNGTEQNLAEFRTTELIQTLADYPDKSNKDLIHNTFNALAALMWADKFTNLCTVLPAFKEKLALEVSRLLDLYFTGGGNNEH